MERAILFLLSIALFSSSCTSAIMLPGYLSEVIQNAIAIDSTQIPYLQVKFADSGFE
jgi:hypothetical protein